MTSWHCWYSGFVGSFLSLSPLPQPSNGFWYRCVNGGVPYTILQQGQTTYAVWCIQSWWKYQYRTALCQDTQRILRQLSSCVRSYIRNCRKSSNTAGEDTYHCFENWRGDFGCFCHWILRHICHCCLLDYECKYRRRLWTPASRIHLTPRWFSWCRCFWYIVNRY